MSRWSYHVPILGYHRVGPYKSDHVPTVTEDAFERQLAFLAKLRYRVLSLAELAASLDRGEPQPRHATVITFDDGYEETHSVAWPLLKRFGFPATVFVTPAEVGTPGFMTWEQVRELSADGFTIGSHTMHHSYLPLVDAGRLPEELVQSKQVIEERIGRPAEFLSYPVGGFTSAVQTVARQAGYRAACTTNRIMTDQALDRYALRRIKVTERDGQPLLFWAKLSGHYDAFRQLKRPS
jgi:peptidoglycan/xylan/chitin deacetylase (PgdA/CDA1 family)